ncbi:hypothetical protein GY45DRAFT_1370822 [Cubamyces sp. BRFM 1775]|nr:hypothetical protein GY45DRAFT_1370822 [Cubamyces sp. BRFM 1775]
MLKERRQRQKDLVQLAILCRPTSEIALDELWRSIDDFKYILYVFKAYDRKKHMFTDKLTDVDKARFDALDLRDACRLSATAPDQDEKDRNAELQLLLLALQRGRTSEPARRMREEPSPSGGDPRTIQLVEPDDDKAQSVGGRNTGVHIYREPSTMTAPPYPPAQPIQII